MTLTLPDHVDDRELANAARSAGVSVPALSSYAINRLGLRGLVIGYGRLHQSAIVPAVAAVTSALQPVLSGAT